MNITETIIRDVCETEAADPGSKDTICINVDDLRIILEDNLAAIESKPAEQSEQKLDKRAQVGNTRFGVGVKWSTVIGAAQRYHDFMNTPEKESDRIENAKAFLATLTSRDAADHRDSADAKRYQWLSKRVVITDGSTPGLMVITAVDDGFEYGNQFLDEFTEPALAAIESQRSGEGA
jgi:hypothetical protein